VAVLAVAGRVPEAAVSEHGAACTPRARLLSGLAPGNPAVEGKLLARAHSLVTV